MIAIERTPEASAFPRRQRAEAAVAARFPVLFALWAAMEAGASDGVLAQQLGTSPARLLLIREVAEYLIDQVEAGTGPIAAAFRPPRPPRVRSPSCRAADPR